MDDGPRLSEAKRKLLELQRRGKDLSDPASANSQKTSLLKPRVRKETAPLSFAQEQVWRLDQKLGHSPLHNESITIHRRGGCNLSVLQRSLGEIVRRHEMWRTTFDERDGRPVQIVHPARESFDLAVNDLRSVPEVEREKKAIEAATDDARQPFDLKQGPLLRARVVTLSDNEHRLYLTAHQSIVDGITVFDIFPAELTALYESFAAGNPSPLRELQAQFTDFAVWQRETLTPEKIRDQLAYWENQLSGELPVLQWPNYRERPSQQSYRGAMYSFEFPAKLAELLKQIAHHEGATLFMVLTAALVSLLQRYTGQEDIIVGTLAPCGRKRTEFQRCIGYFLNPVALRADVSGDPSFASLLKQIRNVTLGAISNDDVTLEMIAERLQMKPDPSRHPFFNVAISVAPDVPALPSGWNMTYMDVESGGARWDLYLEFSDRAHGLLGRAQYNPDLLTASEIAGTIQDFKALLEEIASV